MRFHLPALGRGGRPLRIAYGRIFHEANAYSPLLTEQADFERLHAFEGAALAQKTTLRGAEIEGFMPHAELSGFAAAAAAAGGVATVPLASFMAVPGGPLSAACFEWLLGRLLGALRDAGPVDGVYLALHGSMEVVGLDEAPEAVILREVRAIIGDGAMLAVSYDLHANLSPGLVDPVDVLIAYRANPHWDLAPTGWRAGNRLIRALRGQVRPVQAWRKLPLVLGGGVTIDFMAPMRGVFRWMKRLERDPRVLSASLFMVHPFTSAGNLGWAVHVATDGDPALAAELADQLADRVWEQRTVGLPAMRSVDEALDEVLKTPWRRTGPVTLVDVDDIVGAGAPGGSTQIIRALVANDRGLNVLVPVHDPAAVVALWEVPLGERASVTLRGTPGYDQPEVALEGVVAARHVGDGGRTVRVASGSFQVAICERPPLPIHPKFWRELGQNPRRADAMVQKNFFHYRIFHAALSFHHIPVVSAGASSMGRVRDRTYTVPVYPMSEPSGWREFDAAMKALPRVAAPLAPAPKRARG